MPTKPSKNLETFSNPQPERDYIIHIEAPEFTCLCPKTGQPDFATLFIEYVPDRLCVELKALKLYIWSYRDQGAFHEDVTNKILDDLVKAAAPRWMRLTARFNVRGGIYTTIEAEFRKPGWEPPPPPPDYLPREETPAVRGKVVTETPAPRPKTPEPAPVLATAPAAATDAPRSERFRMLRRAPRKPVVETGAASARLTSSTPPAVETPPQDAQAPAAAAAEPELEPVYLGIDLGSSGCRVVAIDAACEVLAHSETPIPVSLKKDDQVTQDPTRWWKAVSDGLENVLQQIDRAAVRRIAVDGTSGTVLLCDDKGSPTTPAIMYSDRRSLEQARRIAECAAAESGAHGASSGLAKLLWLQDKRLTHRATYLLNQADWINGRLTGRYGHSDYNNCLKLGYDAINMEWPSWFEQLGVEDRLLPQVYVPGEPLGPISAEIAKGFGLPPDTGVVAGSTDGVAGFLAAGATEPGHAVTVLGSTLVLKLLSKKPVFSADHGVYSHRLGNLWLAGGASNSGGAALLQYFKIEQMREMSPLLDPDRPTGLDYYPLPDVGERFPICDPNMIARLEPLPGDSVTFFQGMLEGIARIEAQGYRLLQKLGAPKLTEVRTTGGGSHNPAWTRIRARILKVPINKPHSDMAAYGAALLAAGAVSELFGLPAAGEPHRKTAG